MICPFCHTPINNVNKNEILQKGWTCPNCGKSIPCFSSLKVTKNSFLKSKAKQLYIDVFFLEFKDITFVQHKTHKVKTYAEAISFKDLVKALESNIDSLNKWPKCRYCKERPVYFGKDFCMHYECIQKANHHKNPMVKDKQTTMEKIRKSMLERYGVTNANQLKYVREIKRQKQLQYWHKFSNRVDRANKLNESYGVYNAKQNKQIINAIRSKLNLPNNAPYDTFLKHLFERVFLQLKEVELLEPKTFEEFIFRQGDGNTRYKFKCKNCGCEFYKYASPISVAYNKLINNIETIKCPRCYASKSLLEKEVLNSIADFIDSTYDIYTNDHKIIHPYEIDILIQTKDHSIGIDIDGLFFHSTQYLKAFSKDYDDFMQQLYKLKQKLVNKYQKIFNCPNLRYLAILENSWKDNKDFWLSKILLLLNQKQHIKRVYARNINLQVIDHETAKTFLDKHHIQGYIHATYHIGFFSPKDELLGVASFGKTSSRKALSQHSDVTYELYRLAFKPYVQIIGGLSKLNNFIANYLKIKEYVTYVDLSLGFSKQSWERLGFKVISYEPLTYMVYDNQTQTLHHRLYIRKYIPKGYTESQFVFESQRFDLIFKPGNVKLKK